MGEAGVPVSVSEQPAVRRPFTPDLHEAAATTPAGAEMAGTVVEELEPGYKLGDKLLRPARVVVVA